MKQRLCFFYFCFLAILALAFCATALGSDPLLGVKQPTSDLSDSERPAGPPSHSDIPRSLSDQSPNLPSTLPEVTVVGEHTGSLVTPSGEEAHETLSRFPGGTNYINASEYERGRSANLENILAFQPGVYVEQTSNIWNQRISIRGSGLGRPAFRSFGIAILQDGLPWNRADGSSGSGFSKFDPLAIQYVEVYRGADALAYGSAMLGGAINFVSQTGYTSPLFTTRLEAGSFGYLQGHMAGGSVEGPVDFYGSLSETYETGFQDHSEANSIRLMTNVGYRLAEDVENRIYYSYINERNKFGGSLTLAQLESDPEQADPRYVTMDFRRFHDFHRLADLATLRLDPDQELRLGVSWINDQIWHPIGIFFHGADNDFAAMCQYRGSTGIFGHPDQWVVGLLPQGGYSGGKNFSMFPGRPDQGPLQANSFSVAATVPLYGENRFSVTDDFTLITGLQVAWAYRSNEAFTFIPSPPSHFTGSASSSKDYYGVNPKVGILWEFEPKKYLYANFSRSFEPPTLGDLVPAAALLPPREALFPLSAQRASTAEIGTRGSSDRIRWDIDFYHSWVDDELLIYFPNPKFPTISQTINATPTHHMGVEAALDLWLSKGILTSGNVSDGSPTAFYPREGKFFFGTSDGILLRQVYTWSRFSFDHDPVYHDNTLPVIPEHFYQAELLYTHPSGFYIGPNVTVSSKVWTDFANTLAAPGWAILGFRMGVQRAKGPSFFFEGRNLTNQRYAATVNPIVTAQGKDQPVFLPGSGWALYGGVQWAF